MAPITRNQVRREIKRKTGKLIKKDGSDILLALDYSLFLKDLLKEAERLSDIDGSSQILPTHIQLARIKVLKQYRG